MTTLITGVSSDFSKTIIEDCLKRKKKVVFTSSSEESLRVGQKLFKDAKGYFFDFSQSSQFEKYWSDILGKEEISEIVLCAHERVSALKRFHEHSFQKIAEHLTHNILGMSYLLHSSLDHMIKNQFGRVVFLSSISTEQGTSRYPAYIAAKSAIEGLMKNLAVDYGHDNINFNTIRLGIFATSRNERLINRKSYLEKMERIIPQGRYGNPQDILPLLNAFLDEHSYANGSTVNAGGGFPLVCSEGLLT